MFKAKNNKQKKTHQRQIIQILYLLHTCVQEAAGQYHGASRPEWWRCPGPGVRWRDDRRGRPGGSAGRGTGGAGPWRGRRILQTSNRETHAKCTNEPSPPLHVYKALVNSNVHFSLIQTFYKPINQVNNRHMT